MKKVILASLFGGLSLGLTACTPSSAPESSGPASTVYVRGNPDAMFAGATGNKTSPIKEANIAQWGQIHLVSLTEFPEKDDIVQSTNLIKENAPHQEGAPTAAPTDIFAVKFERNQTTGQWRMNLLGGMIFLEMKRDGQGGLQPVVATDGKSDRSPVEVVHWSVRNDGKYMSLLIKSTDSKKGHELIALYFEKNGVPMEVKHGNKDHQYLGGAGVDIGWKIPAGQDLNVHVCGSSNMPDSPEAAVSKWNQVLKNRLHMNLTRVFNYAPFSDLNEHCIQVIDAYLMDGRPRVGMYGVTISPLSLQNQEIIDSDVFLFQKEFDKETAINGQAISEEHERENAPIALVHEMGHFLGLDHKFDGTKSVMSYAFDSSSPTDYDISAVQELYPLY